MCFDGKNRKNLSKWIVRNLKKCLIVSTLVSSRKKKRKKCTTVRKPWIVIISLDIDGYVISSTNYNWNFHSSPIAHVHKGARYDLLMRWFHESYFHESLIVYFLRNVLAFSIKINSDFAIFLYILILYKNIWWPSRACVPAGTALYHVINMNAWDCGCLCFYKLSVNLRWWVITRVDEFIEV